MVSKHSRVLVAFCALLAILILSQGAVAQNYWMRPATERSVSLDFFKASYNDVDGLEFLTSMVYLSALIPANDRLTFVFDFPMSNINTDDYNESLFGNPYLGVEISTTRPDAPQSFFGRLGFRPPLASDEKFTAAIFGAYGMFDRYESFVPDIWTLSGGFGYTYHTQTDVVFGIGLGGDLMIPSEGEDAELFVDYNLSLWYRPEMAKLGFGFSGRMIATEGDLDFGERTFHQLGLFAGYDFGTFEPGFHFRVPLDEDLTEVLDFVYGVNLTVAFE